jgi:hypothetical protein
MPDTQKEGAIERLLIGLVPDCQQQILAHAELSTSSAIELGSTIRPSRFEKAVLHTWLAWQEEPGRPYGVAVKAQ